METVFDGCKHAILQKTSPILLAGLVHLSNGETKIGDYAEMLDSVVASEAPDLLRGFSLTIGVVSNHGNWFTSDDHNKELKVLVPEF